MNTKIRFGRSDTGIVIGDLTWDYCKQASDGGDVSTASATLVELGNGSYLLGNPNITADTYFSVHVTADSTKYNEGAFYVYQSQVNTVNTAITDMTEDDGGVKRFTTNALENAPGVDAAAIDAQLSGTHGAGSWTGATTAEIDAQLSGTHGAGSWAGATTAEIDAQLSGSHGAGAWTGATAAAIDAQLSSTHGSGSWASSSSGTGDDTVTITVNDDDSNPIADCHVWITSDSDGTTVVAGPEVTDDSGQVEFLLDAGVTYYCWRRKAGKNFDNPQTFVAVAD